MGITRIKNPSVVIDISTRLTMVGFTGEQYPRFTFPTVVGYPSMETAKDDAEYYVGQESLKSIPLRLVYPIKGGFIEDWSAIEAIYAHALSLLEVNLSNTRVLLTENDFNPRKNKERITQMLFHDFGVSHLFHAPRSVLTLIAIRKRTGIVIDFEPEYISIVSVYDEKSIPHAMQIHDPPTTAGLEISLITKQIGIILDQVDPDIHTELCDNIVLTGSSTTTANFETTLYTELQEAVFSEKPFRIIALPERLYLPWIGGSIFGNR